MAQLTTAKLRALKEPGRYGDGRGLYLNVAKSGTKSWVQRCRVDGKRTDKGLGGFPSVGLSEARRLAESNRVALARGRNPWQSGTYAPEARVPIDIPNFEQTARRFHQVNLDAGGWTNVKNVAAWLGRAEKYLFPKIGGVSSRPHIGGRDSRPDSHTRGPGEARDRQAPTYYPEAGVRVRRRVGVHRLQPHRSDPC